MTPSQYPDPGAATESMRTNTGKLLSALTLDNVISEGASQRDFTITRDALLYQAGVARDALRHTLAENLERASELVSLPNDMLIETYELLRPGRAGNAEVLLDRARLLRETYGAKRAAAFLEEAAQAYGRRGLFRKRY